MLEVNINVKRQRNILNFNIQFIEMNHDASQFNRKTSSFKKEKMVQITKKKISYITMHCLQKNTFSLSFFPRTNAG